MALIRSKNDYARELSIYQEAVMALGEAYDKIVLLNRRTGMCRYLKAKEAEEDLIGVWPGKNKELNYAECLTKTSEKIVHSDYQKAFLERFSLERLKKYDKSADYCCRLRYLRWDVERRDYHWVEAECRKRSSGGDELVIYIKDIQEQVDCEMAHQQELIDMQENVVMAYAAKRHFVKRASNNLLRPVEELREAGRKMDSAICEHDYECLNQSVQDMHRMTERLWEMSKELLDLDQLHHGEMKLDVRPFDVNHLTGSCKEFFYYYSAGKKLSFMCIGTLEGTYLGDEQRIRQMLYNLLENAIDSTEDGGTILMIAEQNEDKFVFTIRDTGAGMKPEDTKKMSKPFYLGENQEYKYESGIGIGLPLVRGILDQMNGEITFESELGVGTVVSVSFPLKKGS